MKTAKYYTISINGQSAVDAARKFCRGACYRGIYNHGQRLAQLEVVVDDPGTYNGAPNKWVDVSYITSGASVDAVLRLLKKLGFTGCPCIVTEDTERGCAADSNPLFCTII